MAQRPPAISLQNFGTWARGLSDQDFQAWLALQPAANQYSTPARGCAGMCTAELAIWIRAMEPRTYFIWDARQTLSQSRRAPLAIQSSTPTADSRVRAPAIQDAAASAREAMGTKHSDSDEPEEHQQLWRLLAIADTSTDLHEAVVSTAHSKSASSAGAGAGSVSAVPAKPAPKAALRPPPIPKNPPTLQDYERQGGHFPPTHPLLPVTPKTVPAKPAGSTPRSTSAAAAVSTAKHEPESDAAKQEVCSVPSDDEQPPPGYRSMDEIAQQDAIDEQLSQDEK